MAECHGWEETGNPRKPQQLAGLTSAKSLGCAVRHRVFVCLCSYRAICSDLIMTQLSLACPRTGEGVVGAE